MAENVQNSSNHNPEQVRLDNEEELENLSLEILELLQAMFTTSFEDFSTSWEDNCVPALSESDKRFIANSLSRLSFRLVKARVRDLKQFVCQRFIKLRVRSFMEAEPNDAEFLELICAFIDYFQSICKDVGQLFRQIGSIDLKRALGNRTVPRFLRCYGLRQLLIELQNRLIRSCNANLVTLRRAFPYASFWAYRGVTNSSFAKLTAVIKEFFPTELFEMYQQSFRRDALLHVATLIQNMSGHMSEKRFLVAVKSCIEAERLLFKKLFDPLNEDMISFTEDINNKFCREHATRKKAGVFKSYTQTLITPETRFDPMIFGDLVEMYVLNASDFANEFICNFKDQIRRTLRVIFKTHAPMCPILPSTTFPVPTFQSCIEELSERACFIRRRLDKIPNISVPQEWFFEASSELRTETDMSQHDQCNVDVFQSCAIAYLCCVDGEEEDEISNLKLIGRFFRLIANQSWFMEKLFEEMQSTFLNSKKVNLSRLIVFKALPHVRKRVSDNIINFIRDIVASGRNNCDLETEFDESDQHVNFKASYVFKEIDWEALRDKENLLFQPKELMPMQDKVEESLKAKIGEDKDIRRVNALATVTIRTHLFTKDRKFTRINLLLYQALLLNLFNEADKMPMSDIYSALIRDDIPDDCEQRANAEDVVHRLIQSMREPFPLLLTAFDPHNPDPSKFVHINDSFTFDDEEVSLIGQNLVREDMDYEE